MDIAFIGIGSMGAAMVPHLVQAGHHLAVWNRNPAPARELRGVSLLDRPSAAFQHEVVITMLADDAAVREVIIDSEALQGAHPQCVHVMMATISTALVQELVELHRDKGIAYVAAPVFGVPAVAANAQLNIMAAGPADALARVHPLLEAMSQRVWQLGDDPVHANVVKIAGNLMIAQAIEAMAEAASLAEAYGLPSEELLQVLTSTMFACPSYRRYAERISHANFEPGFKLTLGLKDVNLALEAAEARQVPLPAANVVRERMALAIELGLGSADWSACRKSFIPELCSFKSELLGSHRSGLSGCALGRVHHAKTESLAAKGVANQAILSAPTRPRAANPTVSG